MLSTARPDKSRSVSLCVRLRHWSIEFMKHYISRRENKYEQHIHYSQYCNTSSTYTTHSIAIRAAHTLLTVLQYEQHIHYSQYCNTSSTYTTHSIAIRAAHTLLTVLQYEQHIHYSQYCNTSSTYTTHSIAKIPEANQTTATTVMGTRGAAAAGQI